MSTSSARPLEIETILSPQSRQIAYRLREPSVITVSTLRQYSLPVVRSLLLLRRRKSARATLHVWRRRRRSSVYGRKIRYQRAVVPQYGEEETASRALTRDRGCRLLERRRRRRRPRHRWLLLRRPSTALRRHRHSRRMNGRMRHVRRGEHCRAKTGGGQQLRKGPKTKKESKETLTEREREGCVLTLRSVGRSRHETGHMRGTSSSSSRSAASTAARLSKERRRRRWRMAVRLELRSRTGRVDVRHLLLLLLRRGRPATRLSRISHRNCRRRRRAKLLLLLLLLSKLVVVRRRKGWGCVAAIAAAVHPELLRLRLRLLMRMRMRMRTLQMRTTATRNRLRRRRRRRHRHRRRRTRDAPAGRRHGHECLWLLRRRRVLRTG